LRTIDGDRADVTSAFEPAPAPSTNVTLDLSRG